jgi:RNA polymerase sigma factor (sigma-70 family)
MDARGFERLVREHQHMVFCVAYSYCKDRAAAEDVAQDAFLKAMERVDELREPSTVKTWLYSIAKFTAIDWLRRRRREQVGPVPDRVALAPAEDRAAQVLGVLGSLKEDHREIMMLRYVKGMSYAQIGRLTGLTPSAVGEKLHRLREMVRERLKTEVRS